MDELRILNLPTEVQIALEVMPCQAMRRVYEPAQPGGGPHPCAYFGEWGVYHSHDYPKAGPPATPGIEQKAVYAGKAALVPELLSGCRKAPLMAVGINPNLPGYWSKSRNALNPLFDDFLQYAHYFRYRSVAKLQIPRETYDELRGTRDDPPTDAAPLTTVGQEIPVEPAPMTMYRAYQSLLDELAARMQWSGHRLSVGEDLSYANMVACPSAKWLVNRPDPHNPEMPVMGAERMKGIVRECFHDRKYFLRQLFQSLPGVLLVFSESTARVFISAMAGNFVTGDPKPDEPLDALLSREIRLGYGRAADAEELSARVVFLPHASANPDDFAKYTQKAIDILAGEVATGRLTYNPESGHLRRPAGNCVFCANQLYRIGPCDYLGELRPLARPEEEIGLSGAAVSVETENAEQDRLLQEFLTRGVHASAAPGGPADRVEPALTASVAPTVADLLNVDPPIGPAFVLGGRVVTMNPSREVIEKGRVYINKGAIVAIAAEQKPAPEGFENAPLISTGGTIYPGLFDLHNHLAYNCLTLWSVPQPFTNRSAWQRHPDYRMRVSMPLDVLTQDPSTAKAIVRYVETKELLGGGTGVQGMRSRHGGLLPLYAGGVRNFERTDDPRLPHASGRIINLDIKDHEDVESFRTQLQKLRAYFYHLAEGVDGPAREQYLNLERTGLLRPSLVGIHALGLEEHDVQNLKGHGAKMVWSPMSNLLLYGRTLDVNRLVRSGIAFGLGCDWSPSGSKNLLEEMKVAWLTAGADAATLSYEAICAAVTCEAAAIVGWQDALGSLEVGKYADVLVVEGGSSDPYQLLVEAREDQVQLVVIAGQPRYGDAALMTAFGFPAEELEALAVGGKPKSLHLARPASLMGFAEAQAKLRESMSRLRDLEAELQTRAFEPTTSDEWQIALDNDDFTSAAGLAPELLAGLELPKAVSLDVPTVIDDPSYFEHLETIGHLPSHLKALSHFYQ